jgi:hypothetical protein
MPPKGQGRTLQEKNFAQTVVGELTAPENRQVLTAVGLFVVSSSFLITLGGMLAFGTVEKGWPGPKVLGDLWDSFGVGGGY